MKLTVKHKDIDLTLKMDDLTNPAKTIDLTEGEILLGFHKPVKHFYIELVKADPEVERNLLVQFFDGEFKAVPSLEDRTFGLNRSGFVFIGEIAQVKTAIDGKEMYWLKVSTSVPAPVEIHGINLVLSDDTDFGLIPNIMEYLPDNMESFIGFHQEARNLVLQTIRNSGKVIRDNKCDVRQVDQFDILDISEFRQAAKYMALHLIFDFLSKGEDDHYAIKSKGFLSKSEDSLNSRLMRIDSNDNGKTDSSENKAMGSIRIVRE